MRRGLRARCGTRRFRRRGGRNRLDEVSHDKAVGQGSRHSKARDGAREGHIPARTSRTFLRSATGMAAKALMARPMSFLRSKRLMLSMILSPPSSSLPLPADALTSASSRAAASTSTQG